MAHKIKVTLQHLGDKNESLAEVSVVSPDYPSEEICHDHYIDLARQLLAIMEGDVDIDTTTIDSLGEVENKDEEVADEG